MARFRFRSVFPRAELLYFLSRLYLGTSLREKADVMVCRPNVG